MPGLEEFKSYIQGLWLLVRQNPAGFRHLDLSERGSLRSFWAMGYAAPAIFLSWMWWRSAYLAAMPAEAKAGGLFFFRLALIEAINWIVPLVLVGILAWLLGMGSKFSSVVVAINWLAVPLSYGYGALILLTMLMPGLSGLVALLWFMLLLLVITAYFRVLRMICDGHTLTAAAFTMLLLVPTILFSDMLERFLSVSPG